MASSLATSSSDTDKSSLLISTVLERCKKEKDSGLVISVQDYVARASYYTAIPKHIIRQYDDRWELFRHNTDLIESHGMLIFKSINSLVKQRVLQDFDNTVMEYKVQCQNISVQPIKDTTFKYFLEVFGFFNRQLKNGKVILFENPKLTFERNIFLSKALEHRKTMKKFYYVDARCLSSSHYEKASSQCTSNEDILLYMVSFDGYECGLICNDSWQSNFKKWLIDIAVPKMEENSVVVMDGYCYNYVIKNDITRYHSKKDMMKWLDNRNIPYHESMCKAELYELIEKCTRTKYFSEALNFIKASGHEVLCLPQTLLNLSLANHLCTLVEPVSETKNIKKNILKSINSIPHKVWKKLYEKLKILEKELHKMDMENEMLMKDFELESQDLQTD